MPYDLGSALVLHQAVTEADLARALFTVATEGVPLPRALVALGILRLDRLEEELARVDVPTVRHVVPVQELVDQLPSGLTSRLLALPIRRDPRTGTVDVAVADARDPHAAREIAFFLKAPVRIVRAPLAEIEAALDRGGPSSGARAEALAAPIWVPSNPAPPRQSLTPMWGTPVPRKSTAPPPVLRLASSVPPPSTEAMPIPLLRRAPDIVEGDDAVFALTSRERPVSTAPYGFVDGAEVHTDGRGPRLPFADAAPILAAMRAAESRDPVLEALVQGARAVARKVGLFVLKKDAYVGFRGSPELADERALRAVTIPLGAPGPFTTAATGSYLGPLYQSEATAGVLALLPRATTDVAITPVRVQGRAVALLLADELGDVALATRRLDELCRAAGEALTRVVRRAK